MTNQNKTTTRITTEAVRKYKTETVTDDNYYETDSWSMEEAVKINRKKLILGMVPQKLESGEYVPSIYIMEIFGEVDSESLRFGESTDKKEFIVLRDETGRKITPSGEHCLSAGLLSGLDARHSSLVATIHSELIEGLSPKNAELAGTALAGGSSRTLESIKDGYANLEVMAENLVGVLSPTELNNLSDKQHNAIEKEIIRLKSIFIKSELSGVGKMGPELLDRYAFRKPVMLVGGAGEGKTHMVSQWIIDHSKEYEIRSIHADGHEGFEIPDMLGMMVPNETGGMSWIDGPVTEAFRSAGSGIKTVLFMDEILRIPDRERSLLIGALIPKADGFLSIRTNRIQSYNEDGVGTTEEIKCLPENLWVVAASNIGTGFSVDEMDTAFQDRFRTFRVENGSKLIKIIADKICKRKGFPKTVSKHMVALYEGFQDLKSKGMLQKNFSARHVAEVLTLANTIDDIGPLIQDLEYTVLSINSSGKVNESEKELWETLIIAFD